MQETARMDRDALAHRPVVFFDLDGTVIRSEPAILRVAGEVMRAHGYSRTREEMLPMIGPPLEEGFELVCGMSSTEASVCCREYRELFERTVTPDEFPTIEGVREILDDLVASGRRLAVATSRLEGSARQMIDQLGLDQFDAVIGRVPDLRYSKAESIAGALHALDVYPRDVVMVGDRMHDVIGAAEWEIPCIGFYTGAATPGELEVAGAIATCHDASGLRALLGL